MLLTLSAKLDNATFAGTGVDASERALKSCEEKSRLSSNSSESAGDRGADGIVGAAPQDIADIVEPHGDSGPDQPTTTIYYSHQSAKASSNNHTNSINLLKYIWFSYTHQLEAQDMVPTSSPTFLRVIL